MPESETRVEAFLGRGFALKKNLRYFERTIPVLRQELGALGQLGGRVLARDLWENVAGMGKEKELLERRLVLPLAEADLADEFGVVPPQAVVLFGPPVPARPLSPKPSPPAWSGPLLRCFPPVWRPIPKAWPAPSARSSWRSQNWNTRWCSLTRLRKSIHSAPASRHRSCRASLMSSSRSSRPSVNSPAGCWGLDLSFLRHGRFGYVIPMRLPRPAGARSHVAALYSRSGGGRRRCRAS